MGFRFIGEDDADGSESVGAPVVFFEQPFFYKIGNRAAGGFVHLAHVVFLLGVAI